MQYNLKKDLEKTQKVKLQWHGEETNVLVKGQGAKTLVKTGDVLSVTVEQARNLLRYSHLWTMDGDEPVAHGFDASQAKLHAVAVEKAAQAPEPEANKAPDLTEKEQVMASLRELNVTFNDAASTEELKQLLSDAKSV